MVWGEWEAWQREQGGVAALSRESALSLRERTVPEGARALILPHGDHLLAPGERLEGDAILVRTGEFQVPIRIEDLHDRAGRPGTITLTLLLDPPASRTAFLLFRDRCLARSDTADAADLARELLPPVRRLLEGWLEGSPWDGEQGVVRRLRVGKELVGALEEPLFERGLSLVRVIGAQVDSQPLREQRKRKSELVREAARVRDRLEFLDLWKREEEGEALARSEVERMAAHMRREGLLREISEQKERARLRVEAQLEEARSRGRMRRILERERIATQMEIDEQRLEAEIERARRLEESLQENGLLGMIQGIEDGDERARLIERLIEKEMTPQQLAARVPGGAIRELEARLERIATELRAEIQGGGAPHWASELAPARRVWLAAGLTLYRIGGDGAFRGEEPTPVLPPEDIGYLRSVTVTGSGDETVVLAGGQGGVAVYRPQDSRWSIYPYRHGPRGRGGANSVAFEGGLIFATHSELGLHQWRNGERNSFAPLHAGRIIPGRSTRGVQRGPESRLYFSHVGEVFSFDPADPGGELRSCGGLSESITALEATAETILAGTRDGRVFQWQPPDRWMLLPFATTGPIFRIARPLGGAGRGWVVGAQQAAVHLLDGSGDLVSEYRSRNPIRWVGAAQQGVLGVDRFGQHLLLWRWGDLRAPAFRIRVPGQIVSLALEGGGP
ncbi:MAG: hypothetical protein ACE5GW_00225 [Planctomycetota bacterium]